MKIYLYIFLLLQVLIACNKPESEQTPMGNLIVRISASELAPGENLSSLYISLHSQDSSVVIVHEQLSLSLTDSGFTSASLHLPMGEYLLDGVVLLNYRGESVYFSPKQGSKAAIISGASMPESINLSSQHPILNIPAVNPRSLGIKPLDCGYTDFPNWNSVPSPEGPAHELRCIRIGVGYGKLLKTPLEYKLYADDSLVLIGSCSGGVTEFQVPDARRGYRIAVQNNEFVVNQYFTTFEIAQYSCSANEARFIDLRIGLLPDLPPKKPQIVFIRQETEIGKPGVKLSLMDSIGNIYKVRSSVMLNDSMGKAVFIINSETYSIFQSYMVEPVGVSNKDSLANFQMQFPKIESDLAMFFIPNGMPSPVKIYAVQQLADGRHRALMIDANGAPKGTSWNINEGFLPVRWLWNNNF